MILRILTIYQQTLLSTLLGELLQYFKLDNIKLITGLNTCLKIQINSNSFTIFKEWCRFFITTNNLKETINFSPPLFFIFFFFHLTISLFFKVIIRPVVGVFLVEMKTMTAREDKVTEATSEIKGQSKDQEHDDDSD